MEWTHPALVASLLTNVVGIAMYFLVQRPGRKREDEAHEIKTREHAIKLLREESDTTRRLRDLDREAHDQFKANAELELNRSKADVATASSVAARADFLALAVLFDFRERNLGRNDLRQSLVRYHHEEWWTDVELALELAEDLYQARLDLAYQQSIGCVNFVAHAVQQWSGTEPRRSADETFRDWAGLLALTTPFPEMESRAERELNAMARKYASVGAPS